MATKTHNQPKCSHKRPHKNMKVINCLMCKEDFNIVSCRLNKFCSGWCSRRYKKEVLIGENNPRYKHGVTSNGYKRVGSSKNRQLEHRFVMEKVLGRKLLKSEWVHHINGDKIDNRPENLILVLPETHFSDITCPSCNYHFLIK